MSDPAASGWLEDLAVVRARIAERLETAGRVVPVMSGKGGVGKTAVATNLALALAQRGLRVGLLDADLNSPTVAKVLGLRGLPVRMEDSELLPAEGPEGVAVQSMDFFLQGGQALDWEGPAGEGAPLRSALEDAALADLLGQTRWGERDLLLIDLAPGPDRLPALARIAPGLAGALAVTIPTEVSLLAVERGLRRARDAGIPLLGLVENFGSVVCGRCGHEGPLFREAAVETTTRSLDVPLLGRVPFDAKLAADADAGRPFLDAGGRASPAGRAFATLAERVALWEPPVREGGSA